MEKFIQYLKLIRNLVNLIDKYDDVAKKVLEGIKPLLPANIQAVIEFVFKYEAQAVIILLDILEHTEIAGGSSTEKFSSAFKKLSAIKPFAGLPFADMIDGGVKVINSFVK